MKVGNMFQGSKSSDTLRGEFRAAVLLFNLFASLSTCELKTALRTSLPVNVAGRKSVQVRK